MKSTFALASLLLFVSLSGCASSADRNAASATEICDVKEPVLGSRVVEKIKCAPRKGETPRV